MSLRRKIFISFLLLIIMLVIAGWMTVVEFKKTSTSVDLVIDNNYKSLEQTKYMLEAIEITNSGLLMFLVGDEELGLNNISKGDTIMIMAIGAARENISEPDEELLINNISEDYIILSNSIKNSISNSMNLSMEERNKYYYKENHELFLNTKKAIYNVMEVNQRRIYTESIKMKENAKRAIMPAIVSIASAILFAFILSFFLIEYIVNPIHKIKDSVSTFYPEQYNLKVKINTNDEIKELEKEINNLIARLLKHRNN